MENSRFGQYRLGSRERHSIIAVCSVLVAGLVMLALWTFRGDQQGSGDRLLAELVPSTATADDGGETGDGQQLRAGGGVAVFNDGVNTTEPAAPATSRSASTGTTTTTTQSTTTETTTETTDTTVGTTTETSDPDTTKPDPTTSVPPTTIPDSTITRPTITLPDPSTTFPTITLPDPSITRPTDLPTSSVFPPIPSLPVPIPLPPEPPVA